MDSLLAFNMTGMTNVGVDQNQYGKQLEREKAEDVEMGILNEDNLFVEGEDQEVAADNGNDNDNDNDDDDIHDHENTLIQLQPGEHAAPEPEPESASDTEADRMEQAHRRTARVIEDALASRGRIVQAPALNVEQILSLSLSREAREGARRRQVEVVKRVVSWLRIVEWLHAAIEHTPDEFHCKFQHIAAHMRNDDRVLLHTFIVRPSLPVEDLHLGDHDRHDAQVELLSYYAKMEQIHINYLVAGLDYDESEEMDDAFLALTPARQDARNLDIREVALPQQWAREERDPAAPNQPTWEEVVAPLFASGVIPQLAGYVVRD